MNTVPGTTRPIPQSDPSRARDERRWHDGNDAAHMLDRHLHRIGAGMARLTDPIARLQIDILQLHLSLLQAALDDEDVAPDTARRVMERVMYGAAPNPVDVAERKRVLELQIADLSTRGPRVEAVWPSSEQGKGPGGR